MFVESKHLGYYNPPMQHKRVDELKSTNASFNALYEQCNRDFAVSIVDTFDAGRGLVAKRAFKTGEIIFKEKALAAVVLDEVC